MANIVIPRGLLLSQNIFEPEVETPPRALDVVQQQSDAGVVQTRIRSASISIGVLGRIRETGRQYPHANEVNIIDGHAALRISEDGICPLEASAPAPRMPPLVELRTRSKSVVDRSYGPTHTLSSSKQDFHEPRTESWRSVKFDRPSRVTRDGHGLFLVHDLKRYVFPSNSQNRRASSIKIELPDSISPDDVSPSFAPSNIGSSNSNSNSSVACHLSNRSSKSKPSVAYIHSNRTSKSRASLAGLKTHLASLIPKPPRRGTLHELYEKAKYSQERMRRSAPAQTIFEYSIYLLIVVFVYFILVGLPLWKGTVYWTYWVIAHKLVLPGGFAITVGIAFL